MLYGDNPDIAQKDYDEYYIKYYGFGVADAEAKARLGRRADYIADHCDRKSVVVDFGGGDSGLVGMLKDSGFKEVSAYGCGDTMPAYCDVVIAEHVLEHIYDMDTAMEAITKSIVPNGLFIVDIPDAGLLAFEQPEALPILDFNQVHINHFRMLDMLRLAERWGFELVETEQYKERGGGIRMYVFIHNPNAVWQKSHEFTTDNINGKLEAMRKIGEREVIMWGCGDIALHCLALVPLNVKYFVDIDPAFRGTTIQGKPVLDKPNSDHPILINCQSRKGVLIDYIKAAGYTNELIVV
jgi:predicted SAM-dependent methyltransferase